MSKKLAIKGHLTRGNEVIELLKMMGGKNKDNADGCSFLYYTLCTPKINNPNNEKVICGFTNLKMQNDFFAIFTLEKFWEKFPFKVGDRVHIPEYESEVRICQMKWDPLCEYMEYMVYRNDDEEWYTAEDLLKYNDNPNEPSEVTEEKDKAKAPDLKGEDDSGKRFGYKIPDGYEFDVVVDGKIFIKPIKSKYPIIYEECCEHLFNDKSYSEFKFIPAKICDTYYRGDFITHLPFESIIYEVLINDFYNLLVCRDAYWKIAGEEMGLGKPWAPDWKDETQVKYMITTFNNKLEFFSSMHSYVVGRRNHILSFPTEEMLNAFYENFKDLIESCKELL